MSSNSYNSEKKAGRQASPDKKIGGRSRIMTKEERRKFDAEVARMRLNGSTFEAIAQATGRAKDTCHRAYKRVMVEYKKKHQDDQAVLLSEYHYRMERIWNAHLAKYATTIDQKTGVGDVNILREAGTLYNQIFDRLQSAGLIFKRSDRINLEGQQEIKFVIEDKFTKSKKRNSTQQRSSKPRKTPSE